VSLEGDGVVAKKIFAPGVYKSMYWGYYLKKVSISSEGEREYYYVYSMKKLIDFIASRVQSFCYAFAGLRDVLVTEHNAWIHAIFTVIVLSLALWLQISFLEFVLIVVVITLVWVAEAFNTVLEIVVNMVARRYSNVAKRAKDIAAGAVLVAAIGAAIVGVCILGPPLLDKLGF